MTEFKPRRLAPKKDNECYYSKKNFEYPKWVDECTWYAWGRELECGVPLSEMKKKCPATNAENWYKDSKFDKRVLPELGDILVYSCGKRHHAADGMGHVAIVEDIRKDNAIRITESGHNMKFQTRWIKYPYKYYLNTKGYKYTLDGFVHPQDYDNRYFKENQKYVVKVSKYVRKSACVSTNKVKYDELPSDLKAICTKTASGFAKLKVGKTITPVEYHYDSKGNQWCRIFKYWICNRDTTGYQIVK
jgi:surface antigen